MTYDVFISICVFVSACQLNFSWNKINRLRQHRCNVSQKRAPCLSRLLCLGFGFYSKFSLSCPFSPFTWVDWIDRDLSLSSVRSIHTTKRKHTKMTTTTRIQRLLWCHLTDECIVSCSDRRRSEDNLCTCFSNDETQEKVEEELKKRLDNDTNNDNHTTRMFSQQYWPRAQNSR